MTDCLAVRATTLWRGEDGNDKLYGEADNDILGGGLGNDSLYGGTGADRLVCFMATFSEAKTVTTSRSAGKQHTPMRAGKDQLFGQSGKSTPTLRDKSTTDIITEYVK